MEGKCHLIVTSEFEPWRVRHVGFNAIAMIFLVSASCIPILPGPPPGDDSGELIYNNTTDPTNKGASYIGSAACRSCHSSVGEEFRLHAHANALTPVEGVPPTHLGTGERANIPAPPAGYDWTDVSYILAGYLRGAYFIDIDGFFIQEGTDGSDALWNLGYAPNGSTAGFVPYLEGTDLPAAFDHSCFRCHTTGPQPPDPIEPAYQDNRRGIAGTWHESGVQCEACHGPGSNHPSRPEARDMFVDSSAAFCGTCHTHGDDPNVIEAHDGYMFNNTQYPELLASGGHSDFQCTMCHNPHASPNYDNVNAIRNDCTDCHATQSMALHEGFVFERGDYVEPLTCRSCHMPRGGKASSSATPDIVGAFGHMGDTRTHIFRINPKWTDVSQMFLPGGKSVVKDAEGRAAVSLDLVCLRCHNGIGNAPMISSMTILSDTASGMHQKLLSASVEVNKADPIGERRRPARDSESGGAWRTPVGESPTGH